MKVDTYFYADEAELLQSITDSGYTAGDEGLESTGTLIALDGNTDDNLDYSYWNTIVTNYPVTYDEEGQPDWTPEYSTECYINSVRKGNSKLPSNKKLGGNDRKYFNNFINKFAGEGEIV